MKLASNSKMHLSTQVFFLFKRTAVDLAYVYASRINRVSANSAAADRHETFRTTSQRVFKIPVTGDALY